MLGSAGACGNGRLRRKLVQIEHERSSEIPSYTLYGDAAVGFPDILHVETIAARSGPEGWLIKPHRHRELYQFLWISAGAVRVRADGAQADYDAPAAITTVPGEVHGFSFAPDTIGFVLSVPAATLAAAALPFGGLDRLRRPLALSGAGVTQAAADLPHLFAALGSEYRRTDQNRAAALVQLAGLIALAFMRGAVGGGAEGALVRRFRELLEADYASGRPVAAYARRLGVTPTHLSRTCRTAFGRSALALIHERVVTEARRKLAYTPASVSRVGEELGFVDPAAFTKFFKTRTGLTPRAFRDRLER